MFVLISRGIARLPKEQMQPALLAAIHGSPALHASQLAIGAVCSVLGGYVAARLAKHDLVLNGLVSAWGCVILGIYSIARGKSSEPLLFQLMLLFVITPLAAAAGGYVKAKR
jgi:hypothetical protein